MADETEKPTKPAPAAAPPAKTADEVKHDPAVLAVTAVAGDAILDAKEFVGEITLTIARDRIREVATKFKEAGYRYLVDLTAVDYSTYPGYTGERFAVVYHLYSHEKNVRIRLKTFTPEGTSVQSVTPVWKNANWHEREVWDMFGIAFDGHPNLERILMWEGFNGHPLRKDFPLRGIDTGARIYPEIFTDGQGPKEGSTGKDASDVNLYEGEWLHYGRGPVDPEARPPVKQVTGDTKH